MSPADPRGGNAASGLRGAEEGRPRPSPRPSDWVKYASNKRDIRLFSIATTVLLSADRHLIRLEQFDSKGGLAPRRMR
jgi:hypothetical protein